MFKLERTDFPFAYLLYRRCENFFPLIAAVLLGEQDGIVYADKLGEPTQFYVEHAFGFAQVYGSSVPLFEAELRDYLLVNKNFPVQKVRLYTPHHPDFLQSSACAGMLSLRQRFILDPTHAISPVGQCTQSKLKNVHFVDVCPENVMQIERQFGVVGRFWRTEDDFVLKANAIVAFVNEEPAAVCYAAAIAEGRAEIDVLTLPEYRHSGLGKLVVMRFNCQSQEQGLAPLWDCFTNNISSMALCQASGFIPVGEPYPFFTFSR